MLDDADDSPAFDLPEPDAVYDILQTCRCLRVEPTSPEWVRERTSDWKRVLTGAESGDGPIHD